MTNKFKALQERILEHPGSQFVEVPIIPSVGMMAAAAEASNIFLEDDRLFQWSTPTSQRVISIQLLWTLVSLSEAVVMDCLADLWGALLDGAESWLRSRARNPIGSDDLIAYLPDRCPSGGWPMKKEQCCDAHRVHGKPTAEPFTTYWTAWSRHDPEMTTMVPRRLPEAVAKNAERAYLSAGAYMQFPDVVDLSKAPFVPFWTKEAYFMEEERHLLILSAMWRAAIEWLAEGDMEDAVDFPYQPEAQAIILTNMFFKHERLWRKVEAYIQSDAYTHFIVQTDVALLIFSAADGKVSYRYQEGDQLIKNDGLRLRVGTDRSGLEALLAKVARQKVEKVEAGRS